MDDLGADSAACRLAGLKAMPGSWCCTSCGTSLETLGYVPAFVDGTGSEVSGQYCDSTACGPCR